MSKMNCAYLLRAECLRKETVFGLLTECPPKKTVFAYRGSSAETDQEVSA